MISNASSTLPASGSIDLGDYWLKWGQNETKSPESLTSKSNDILSSTAKSMPASSTVFKPSSAMLTGLTVTEFPPMPCTQLGSGNHTSSVSNQSSINWGLVNATAVNLSGDDFSHANGTRWTQPSLKPSIIPYTSSACLTRPIWLGIWAMMIISV